MALKTKLYAFAKNDQKIVKITFESSGFSYQIKLFQFLWRFDQNPFKFLKALKGVKTCVKHDIWHKYCISINI